MSRYAGRIVEVGYWSAKMYENDEFTMPEIEQTKERDSAYLGMENFAIEF